MWEIIGCWWRAPEALARIAVALFEELKWSGCPDWIDSIVEIS